MDVRQPFLEHGLKRSTKSTNKSINSVYQQALIWWFAGQNASLVSEVEMGLYLVHVYDKNITIISTAFQ